MKAKMGVGDSFKWTVALSLLVLGIAANTYFSSLPYPVRTAVGLLVGCALLLIIGQTTKGRAVWEFIKGARTELHKVIWPTRQETTQTTVLVAVMVVVVALLLWGLDSCFFLLVKLFSA